ncbi:MBL fold metallo-hydrolase [candidate division KSB1 bacterium]|nr:MBL fold metallo-hydrolase [candidate division KSB1 bacterium]MBL7095130.1 MBL fold metallo-hydrolase [candidate division KSB1 bacterium]
MREHPILKQLYSYTPEKRQLAIVWLGQNGFLIKSKSCVFFIDPYLSDFAEQWTYGWKNEHVRMSSIPIQPKELYEIDYVLCTHDHVDHIDPFTIPIISLRNPETKFIAPQVARMRMLGLFVGESNLYLMRGEDKVEFNNLKIHAIPAAHSKLTYDENNGYHFLSYIIEVDDLTIFHAGDTILYKDQTDYLKNFSIDLAFLPINGRQSEELEFEPNFTIEEAIDFAKNIDVKMVIPMHYDMYTLNTANVADFITQSEGKINYKIAQIGIPFLFSS